MHQLPADLDSDVGPARYFDRDETLDAATLAPDISDDRTVASRHRPGRPVRILDLTFPSPPRHGHELPPPARAPCTGGNT